MAAPNPALVESGKMGDTGPTYLVYSVSPKLDQDAEYWVEYDTELIQPGTKLAPDGSQTFVNVMARSRMAGPIPDKLKSYVLMDVQTEGGKNWLVFARNTLPSSQYYANPSNQWTIRKTWRFPAILRSFPIGAPDFKVDIDSGNLIDVTVNPYVIPAFTGLCTCVTSQWWTSQKWSQAQMEIVQPMIPDEVFWNYKNLAEGSLFCLHRRVITPAISGITSIRGQAVNATTVPGRLFKPTNTSTWTDDAEDDDQKQVRGRWFREQMLFLIPFDPIRRKAPKQYTS